MKIAVKQQELLAGWIDTPEGTPVVVTKDRGEQFVTKTRSMAWMLPSGVAVIMVDGISGGYSLERVRKVEKEPMTNLQIAQVLMAETKADRLTTDALRHLATSLQHGGPVGNPGVWLKSSADALILARIISPEVRDQMNSIASRWDELTKDRV